MASCACIGPFGDCPCIRAGRASDVYPIFAKPMGCVCPVGAEQTCQGLTCPRLPPPKQKYVNGEIVWSR